MVFSSLTAIDSLCDVLSRQQESWKGLFGVHDCFYWLPAAQFPGYCETLMASDRPTVLCGNIFHPYFPPSFSQVHLLVRGEALRASKTMADRVLSHNKITVHFNTQVVDAYGAKGVMTGLELRNGTGVSGTFT